MNMKIAFLLIFVSSLLAFPVLAERPADAGVTRTPIEEGEDNWAADNPVSPGTITCPGGELMIDLETFMPYCADSKSGRLHFRDSVLWSCMTSEDERLIGVAVVSINGNLDASFSGPVWGKFKIVPSAECYKDLAYPEAVVEGAESFWHGTWSGQRLFDSVDEVWIGDLKIVGKGNGGNIDGLHFKGTEWIVMYTPFPVPYEFLFDDYPELFNEPEGFFNGTIQE